jgi:hypothetical protein
MPQASQPQSSCDQESMAEQRLVDVGKAARSMLEEILRLLEDLDGPVKHDLHFPDKSDLHEQTWCRRLLFEHTPAEISISGVIKRGGDEILKILEKYEVLHLCDEENDKGADKNA